MQDNKSFFKVTFTTVDAWEKRQLIDKNCSNLQEVHKFMDEIYEEHKDEYAELMMNGMAWWSLYQIPNMSVANA